MACKGARRRTLRGEFPDESGDQLWRLHRDEVRAVGQGDVPPVTEAGRQPWIIDGVMRTREAITPMPGLAVPFVLFTAVYIFLAIVVVFLLRRQFLETGNLMPAQPSEVTRA